jgi:cation diffusion facilitator CzcD-associated flavoprotein CzcO
MRTLSGLAHYPIPRCYPRYLSRDDFISYLKDYARHFNLDIRSGCTVRTIRMSSQKSRTWEVISNNGTWKSEVVVVATGQYRIPITCEWPGQASYQGELLHSSKYTNASRYVGKRVLVVGAGNSGAEIATDLARHGAAHIALSIRTPPPIVPRDPFGLPVQRTAILLSLLPAAIADRFGRLTSRLVLGDLTLHGMPKPGWMPFSSRRVPVIDVGFVEALKAGIIAIRPAVARLTAAGVVYEDGNMESFDTVIAATGFKTGLDQLLESKKVLNGASEPNELPGSPTAYPGLFFVGYTHSLRGHLFEANLASRRLAKNVHRYINQGKAIGMRQSQVSRAGAAAEQNPPARQNGTDGKIYDAKSIRFADWIAAGERIAIELPSRKGARRVEVFTRVEGKGPWLTLLHGFPSSMDWARVLPLVSHRFRVLCFDFPGFGDSDKPTDLDYSIIGQANCVEAVWRHFGIARSYVAAHSLGTIIAIELLHRQAIGALCAEVPKMMLMNAAIYSAASRPVLAQRLMHNRLTGALFSRLVTWSMFRQQYSSLFAKDRVPAVSELTEVWKAIIHRQGKRNVHRLMRHSKERIAHRERWEPTAEATPVPVRYIWGMLDPVEGAFMLDVMRQRIPDLSVRALADTGHSPHLEVPDLVASEILALAGFGQNHPAS